MSAPSTERGSTTRKGKSFVFRVHGIPIDGRGDDELRSALFELIQSELHGEEASKISFTVRIVPLCYSSPGNSDEKVGLVDFRGGVPAFLSPLLKDSRGQLEFEFGEADIAFDCNFFGFTQLYTPSRPIAADVVAITGLDGHAYGSWRGKGSLSRMWLRDFLSKDLPNCRVMTYGYDSKLIGESHGLERILDYGRDFMKEIRKIRTTDEETRRPLFFIAHSFGGIVLAHSLVKAVILGDTYSKMFYLATYGILFFGTPHKGLVVDDIRQLLNSDDHPRHGLLDQIKSNSDALAADLDNFKNIIQGRKIVSFYETQMTRRLVFDCEDGRWKRKGEYITAVVSDSALLQLPEKDEKKFPLSADHSTMVKFDSKHASGYRDTITELLKFQKHAEMAIIVRMASLHDSGHGGIEKDPTPGEWTIRLSSLLPLDSGSRQEYSKEFLKCFRRLNVHISKMPSVNARRGFRRRLENDGQFSNLIWRAENDFEEYSLILKELEDYKDDEADDQ